MAKPTKHYDKWRVRWTDETGKRKSQTFADRKTAELALRKAELAVEERRRGLRPPQLEPRCFTEAADYWRRHRAPLKRSEKDDLSILKRLEAHFGKLLLNDAASWVPAIDRYRATATQEDKTISNHLVLLGSILRVARDLGWLERLPVIKKPRVRLHSSSYNYLRTPAEISQFLCAAREEGAMAHMLYAVAIYTGLRAGELAALRWEDIDWNNRLITVQRSYDGPTKSDDLRHVPILDVLLPLLRAWRLKHPGSLVFTNQDGNMFQPSARIFQEVFHRVIDRAGFPRVSRGKKNKRLRYYIRFHDLRHTFASAWVARGGDLFKLQKILGHKTVTMTERYAHLQPSAFAEDFGRFGKGAPNESADVAPLSRALMAVNED